MRTPPRWCLPLPLLTLVLLAGVAQAAPHKLRIKIDSQPQQAAIYVNSKEAGIVGYTPSTLRLVRGTYTIILELPGFRPVQKTLTVSRSEAFVFPLERQPRPAVLDVRAPAADAAATGAQLFIDGAPVGQVPARVEVQAGSHQVEVKKPGFVPWSDTQTVTEGVERQLVVSLQPLAKVGAILVTADEVGAEVFLDGQRRDVTPALLSGVPAGPHQLEVKKNERSWKEMVTVVGDEQLKVRASLREEQAAAPPQPLLAHLRVVTPVPNAEVYLDGAAAGPAPLDRADLQPGKHFVIVRAKGYAEWKREVDLDPTRPMVLTAELSASGTVKILSNVAGATVLIDGQVAGKTPLVLKDVAAGQHLVEVKHAGYAPARQPFQIDGGEQKILAADLTPVHHGPTPTEVARRMRGMTSFSAVTIDPARFTADIAGGYVPFGQVRLTVGAFRWHSVGMDAGIEVRTIGYFTEGLAHAKLQFLQAGPVAIAFDLAVGGGGGPTKRTDFLFEAGLPFTLLFGDLVRFTAHPYLQVYSDRNCPTAEDLSGSASLRMSEQQTCQGSGGTGMWKGHLVKFGQKDPRARFNGARFMLQAALEVAITENMNLFVIFEGDPVGERQALTAKFSSIFPDNDPQIYGRVGATFKF